MNITLYNWYTIKFILAQKYKNENSKLEEKDKWIYFEGDEWKKFCS